MSTVEYTEYASPRDSRICWNRRELRPPPSAVLSTDSAQRCSQCRPGARTPSDMWVCSASRLTTLERRPAGHPARALARRHRGCGRDQPRAEVLAHQCDDLVVVDVSRDRHHHPFRACSGGRGTNAAVRASSPRSTRRCRSPAGPPGARRTSPTGTRRRACPRDRRRASRSPRARRRARPRRRRPRTARAAPRRRPGRPPASRSVSSTCA